MSLPFSSTAMALGETAKQPNFIVIVIDDMGYSDVGTYGCKDIPTPHIDSLAHHRVRFTNSYSTCAVCSPARAAILTGRYQERYGLDWVMIEPYGVDVHEKTLADLLKKQGYVSAAIGKWHLGRREVFRPLKRGFDSFYGFLGAAHFLLPPTPEGLAHPTEMFLHWGQRALGNSWCQAKEKYLSAPLYRNDKETPHEGYLTEVFTREAVQFIDKNKDRPFFLYLAHGAQHTPAEATQKYLHRFPSLDDREGRRSYAAALSAVDDGVGEILAELRKHDLEKNTVIVFTSDNGGASFWEPRPEILDTVRAGLPVVDLKPGQAADVRKVSRFFQWNMGANGSDNRPLSFGKGVLYDGGVRVPLIIQWPGVAPAGTTDDALISHLDLVPTCVAAAGGTLPCDREYDGLDLRPHFAGKPGAWGSRPLFWRVYQNRAVRSGRWKLVWSGEAAPHLYDLSKDQEERTDLAGEHPNIVKRLQKAWMTWDKKNAKPMFAFPDKPAALEDIIVD